MPRPWRAEPPTPLVGGLPLYISEPVLQWIEDSIGPLAGLAGIRLQLKHQFGLNVTDLYLIAELRGAVRSKPDLVLDVVDFVISKISPDSLNSFRCRRLEEIFCPMEARFGR